MPEQDFARHRPFGWHCDLRQEIIHERLLPRAQRFALAPSIKPVESRRIAFFEC